MKMKKLSLSLVVAALCAFTGSAADQQEEEWEHDTDPIIHLIGDFILSTDLGKVSKDWTDGMEISAAKGYSVNETVYFDYASPRLRCCTRRCPATISPGGRGTL